MPVISFHNAVVSAEDTHILGPINTTLSQDRIGIIGANGSGKSTFARLINGLAEPSAGQVLVDNADVATHAKEIRRRVGFVFSDADSQIIMPTVHEDIAFSLRRKKLSKEDKKHRVDTVLQEFGLSDKANNSPHSLSGGEKQLLALAAVCVINPELIIADEPTTLLDLRNRRLIAKHFSQLSQQLIVVTHDLDLVRDFDRVICIDDAKIVDDGAPQEVIDDYISRMEASCN